MGVNFNGVTVPFAINENGSIATSGLNATDTSLIKSSIKTILMTMSSEIPMMRDFGTVVPFSIFDNLTAESELALKRYIQTALATFEPRIVVTNIVVTQPDANVGKLIVDITYYIIQNNVTDTLQTSLGGN